jgi:hypothetical protein
MIDPQILLEPLLIAEKVDVNRLVRQRRAQPLLEIGPLQHQLFNQTVLAGHRPVAMDHQLIADQQVGVRQTHPAGPRRSASTGRQQAGDSCQQDRRP